MSIIVVVSSPREGGFGRRIAEKEAAEYQKIMAQHFLCEPVGTLTYTSWFLPAGEFADDSVLDRAFELGTKF